MPLKICPRIGRLLKNGSAQSLCRISTKVNTSSAAAIALTGHRHDEKSSEGFGFSRGFSVALGSGALVLGLCAYTADFYPFKEAYCEGGDGVLIDSTLSVPPLKKLRLFTDYFRRRIFFMYERRIRAYSSPEKVFQYFASIKESNEKFYMTSGDLMRAIISVLPPSESTRVRGGFLLGERNPGELLCEPSSFFSLFDFNNDGRISFEEYTFIRTLITTSLESFLATFKMFDRNGDGSIDLMEFMKVMQLMREKNQERIIRSGGHLSTRRSLDSHEHINLLKYLFGSDGKRVLQYKDFIRFLEELHEEILRLEFAHYDCKQQGSIPVQDFGSSMVASASLSNIGRYLRRVDELAEEPRFDGVRISFKDFEQFSKLRKQRKLLALSSYAVDGLNGLSKQDFRWAVSQVCQVDLSDTAVDVIFYIFDTNGDGSLSLTEFLGVQDLREISSVDPLQPGIVRTLRCMWNCTRQHRDPRLHG